MNKSKFIKKAVIHLMAIMTVAMFMTVVWKMRQRVRNELLEFHLGGKKSTDCSFNKRTSCTKGAAKATQDEIANAIGVSRQTFNAILYISYLSIQQQVADTFSSPMFSLFRCLKLPF